MNDHWNGAGAGEGGVGRPGPSCQPAHTAGRQARAPNKAAVAGSIAPAARRESAALRGADQVDLVPKNYLHRMLRDPVLAEARLVYAAA